MKTIIYSLLAIFIFSIITTGITYKSNNNQSILIQSVEKNISSEALSQSAQIIAKRLMEFSAEKPEITVIPDKNQIKIALNGNPELPALMALMIQKGSIGFYETYNQESISSILNGDNNLLTLLSRKTDDSNGNIGCTSIKDAEKVNDYLDTSGLSQRCKFAWSLFSGNSEICLYALKSDHAKGALLKGTDIESFKYRKDTTSESFNIEIKFKKASEELWSDMTKINLDKAIAIVIDNNVIFAPVVKSEIKNGLCSISGKFTLSEVKYIATLASNGELPASFNIVK